MSGQQALVVDLTEPRVQLAAGYISLVWRAFERAERHFDLARAMNPNDATIQIFWAWAQACFGRAEDGLPAAELAFKFNPRHPRWYGEYLARIMFLLRRYEGTVSRLEFRMRDAPTQHRRDMAWLAAAYGLIGRSDLAKQCAAWLVEGLGQAWRGDPHAGPREYIDWLVDNLYLRRPGGRGTRAGRAPPRRTIGLRQPERPCRIHGGLEAQGRGTAKLRETGRKVAGVGKGRANRDS